MAMNGCGLILAVSTRLQVLNFQKLSTPCFAGVYFHEIAAQPFKIYFDRASGLMPAHS